MTAATARRKTAAPDAACAAAVDLARAAAEEEAPAGGVGEHVGVAAEPDADRVVTHLFECLQPGYRGWHWSVTVARASRARHVTVDEVVLVPGADSLLAPAWVPWSERVQPGDLGVGDVLPADPGDPRLAPGFSGEDDLYGEGTDAPLRPTQWEIGLGRPRVLSALGRDEALDRWYDGDAGPRAPIAQAAPGRCASCGFLLTIGGPAGQAFGICANRLSPSDGRAVALDHGCGGYSEPGGAPGLAEASGAVVDHVGYDVLDLGHS
ncbi:MAG: DUF3027 domain-containing protein [Candidatus Nanopelagicales bacterium]